ncbi:MAG: CotH kinase family protein, partial [Treponema sp.]|nr:CotH kinase family protein [Treponema sp.]
MASRDKGAKIFLRAFCALFLGTALLGLTACTAIKNMGKTVLKGRINPEEVVTGLPVMRIRTGNGRAVTGKTEYVSALIEITDPDGGGDNPARPAAIRGRGNTSWDAPKKPYRIKFDKKTSLFGRPAAKSWVLLANYQDTTLFLNSTAFELGKLFNLPFTPHYDHVELVLNGRYEGSYVLTNQIQAGTGRVDIDKDRGFLVELDTHYDEDPKFTTPVLQMPVMIKHPEDTEDGPRIDSVKNALYELEAALFDDSFPDNHYRDLINIDVFVDYIMINEITR